MNYREESFLSHEEENCLKSALAFVVLRKRIAIGLENDFKSNSSKDKYLKKAKTDERNHTITPLVHGLLASTYMKSDQTINSLNNDENISSGIQSNNSGLMHVNETDPHILSMLRLAVSMTLGIYETDDNFLSRRSHFECNKESNGEHPRCQSGINEKQKLKTTFFPPIYDYNNIAVTPFSSLKVVDGLLSHISTLLVSKLNQPSTSPEKSFECVVNLIQDGLFKLVFPTAIYSGSQDSTIFACLNEGESSHSNMRTILSVCTVLHRIVFINNSLGLVAIRSVSRLLKLLYYDQCKRTVICANSTHTSTKNITVSSKKNTDDKNIPYMLPQLSDVIAVNFLYLLEGISAVQVKSERANNNSDDKTARHCIEDQGHRVSNIVMEIQSELKELTIPIPPNEAAQFYSEESKRQFILWGKNNSASLIKKKTNALNVRRRSQGNEGLCETDIAGYNEKKGELENCEDKDDKNSTECLCLCPAAKIMFRLFLFDVLDRLSMHAT